MVDMTLSEYALITDMNVSMTGYGCKTVDQSGRDVSIREARESIEAEPGM